MKKKQKKQTRTELQQIVEDYKTRKYDDTKLFFQLCTWQMKAWKNSNCKEKIADYLPCKRYDEQ